MKSAITLFLVATAMLASQVHAMPQPQSAALKRMSLAQVRKAMLDQVNAHRRRNGLKPVCLNAKLDAAAQAHSDHMAKVRKMEHSGIGNGDMGDRIQRAGYSYRSASENIAAGQDDVDDVMSSWIKSPGHNRNLLSSSVTQLGVGMAYSNDQYGVYWTQNFGSSGSGEACYEAGTTPSTPAPTPKSNPATPKAEPNPTGGAPPSNKGTIRTMSNPSRGGNSGSASGLAKFLPIVMKLMSDPKLAPIVEKLRPIIQPIITKLL